MRLPYLAATLALGCAAYIRVEHARIAKVVKASGANFE